MKFTLNKLGFFCLAVVSIGQFASAACEIPNGQLTGEALNRNKVSCIAESRFLLSPPNPEDPNLKDLIINPKSKGLAINNDEVVYCRYQYQKQNGNSAKFRCARTNEQNQLFDSKGNLVPEAVSLKEENDDVYLIDASGQKINDAKAEIMKVRYYAGDKRNVENYSSTAASRILWLLGVPAHTNIMTNKVVCFGCGSNPFSGQKAPLKETTEFKDASIEVKFKAKRLYAPTEQPWNWSDLNSMTWDNSKKIEIEIMAMANHFLSYTSEDRFQNAIVCEEKDSQNENICLKPIVMTHDIGGAFGDRTKRGLFGGTRPRGDLSAYSKALIFKKGSCEYNYSSNDRSLPLNISREGQQAFLERAKILTEENLISLFSASHIAHIKTSNPEEVSNLNKQWAQAILNKVAEVQNAPCH